MGTKPSRRDLRAAADQRSTTDNTETNGSHGLLEIFWTVRSVLYVCGAPPPHALARRLRASLGPQSLCVRELRGCAFNTRRVGGSSLHSRAKATRRQPAIQVGQRSFGHCHFPRQLVARRMVEWLH